MTESDYGPPVSQLLALGDPRDLDPEFDYLSLDLTWDQVPELIHLAQEWSEAWWDRTDDIVTWRPIHAWRALGALRAKAAVEPLVGVVARKDELDEDWIAEELPDVFARIGPPAVPALSAALADAAVGLWARVTLATSLGRVGEVDPEARQACVAALSGTLAGFAGHDPILNTFLIGGLVDLEAIDAAPLMEQAFAALKVDPSVYGDWEDVQISLGLLDERQTPPPNYFQEGLRITQPQLTQFQPEPQPSRSHARSQKKTKRKQQKAARRRQCKRKK